MTYIPDQRNLITIEETQFRSAVSESTLQKVGGLNNFIANRNYQEKDFFLNGPFWINGAQNAVDGLSVFQYDALILDTWMYIFTNGSTSGVTELDIKYSATPGGSFASIFSTTPKINYNAGDFTWIHVGSSVANTTAPVLSTTNVVSGGGIRMDLLQVPGGTPVGCGIIVTYRPR